MLIKYKTLSKACAWVKDDSGTLWRDSQWSRPAPSVEYLWIVILSVLITTLTSGETRTVEPHCVPRGTGGGDEEVVQVRTAAALSGQTTFSLPPGCQEGISLSSGGQKQKQPVAAW